MMLLKKIIFLLLISLSTEISIAQERISENPVDKYQVINWNTEEGLIWGRLNAMLKDKDGFLWITSEFGLNRFADHCQQD